MFLGHPFLTGPFLDTERALRGYVDLALSLEAEFTLTIYVASSAGFATKPTDLLRSHPFRGVLDSYRFHRSINGNEIGTFTTGDGTLVINNSDAYYDFLPLSYTVDARPITVRLTRRNGSYDDALVVAKVTATGWFVDTGQVSIDLIDFSYKLAVPLQSNVYGGTGAKDGTADLAGKRKPLSFGFVREVPAVPLVPALLIYQVHDGSIAAVTAVYDRGVELAGSADYPTYAALAVASVPPGQFASCLAEGLFKLGSSPDGTVTADIEGENSNGYIETTADIVRWAIANRTTLVDPTDIDTASFDHLNAEQPAPVNYWVGPDDTPTVADFVANLMGGIGGWGGHTRDGLFEVRLFVAPEAVFVAPAVLTLNDADWQGWTLRQVINGSLLSAAGSGTIFVTLETYAGTSAGSLDQAWIGQAAASGDAYDFDGNQVQLKFSGSTSRVLNGAEEFESDAIAFSFDPTRPIIISASFSGTAVNLAAIDAIDGAVEWEKNAADAGTTDATGYSLGPNLAFIKRIDSVVPQFTRNDIIGDDLRREPLPSAYRPPPWRWRVAYARSWTVQTDIAGGVSAAHRAFIAEPYRLAEASSAAIKIDHPFAQDRDPVQSYFSNYADALAEAERRLDLFRSSRNLYRMTLPRAALALDLGDMFEITHPRFDLSFGRLLTVIELTETVDTDRLDTVEVVAYG